MRCRKFHDVAGGYHFVLRFLWSGTRHVWFVVSCGVAGAWFGGGAMAWADTPEEPSNPYQVILDRNPFGLRPPPLPPTNNAAAAARTVPTNIKFTGITFDGVDRNAWLILQTGQTNKPIRLREGEAEDGVKILKIDEVKSIVQVDQSGNVFDLTFEKHGMAPAKPVPGAPPAPGAAPAMASVAPASPGVQGPVIVGRGGTVSTTSSPVIQPIPAPAGGSGGDFAGGVAAVGGSLRSIPPRNVQPVNQAVPVQEVSPEAQYLMMNASAELGKRQGIPMPPVPPLPGQQAPPVPPTAP